MLTDPMYNVGERSIKDEKLEGWLGHSMEGKEGGQVWGGDDQDYYFRHVECEMPIRHQMKTFSC